MLNCGVSNLLMTYVRRNVYDCQLFYYFYCQFNSWEVMRLYTELCSGWAVSTFVFPCSSNKNLQGRSGNKIRELRTSYNIWHTYTVRFAVALLVQHPDIQYKCVAVVFLFLRESWWVINFEAQPAHCQMTNTMINPGRILPHTSYRSVSHLNSSVGFLFRRRNPRYVNMESLLRCRPPILKTC